VQSLKKIDAWGKKASYLNVNVLYNGCKLNHQHSTCTNCCLWV